MKDNIRTLGIAGAVAVTVLCLSIGLGYTLYRDKPIVKRGYEVLLTADGQVVKKEEKKIDFAALFASADKVRGEKIFKKCASCHTVGKGEAAKVGPNLFGVVGRKRASMPGFSYSEAITKKGGSWDRESIGQFVTKPKDFIPGTKMAFPGLKKPQDRADVILFLEGGSR